MRGNGDNRVNPTLNRVWKGVCVLAGMVFLLMVLSLEDLFLWHIPRGLSWLGGTTVQTRCSELKVGMNRIQVLGIIHRGVVPTYEYDLPRSPLTNRPNPSMVFFDRSGACEVHFNSTEQSVTSVKFER